MVALITLALSAISRSGSIMSPPSGAALLMNGATKIENTVILLLVLARLETKEKVALKTPEQL
jgi:hypothetical protein